MAPLDALTVAVNARDTASRVETRLDDHEDRCAERYEEIKAFMEEHRRMLQKGAMWLLSSLFGIIGTLVVTILDIYGLIPFMQGK